MILRRKGEGLSELSREVQLKLLELQIKNDLEYRNMKVKAFCKSLESIEDANK